MRNNTVGFVPKHVSQVDQTSAASTGSQPETQAGAAQAGLSANMADRRQPSLPTNRVRSLPGSRNLRYVPESPRLNSAQFAQRTRRNLDVDSAVNREQWEMVMRTQAHQLLEESISLPNLPKEKRFEAFSNIVAMEDSVHEPLVLIKLLKTIETLPETDRSSAFELILKDARAFVMLPELAEQISRLPKTAMQAAFHALLNKAVDTDVLDKLAQQLIAMPESEKDGAKQALQNKRNALGALDLLKEIPHDGSECKYGEAFNLALKKIDDISITCKLIKNIPNINAPERSNAFRAVLDKTTDISVLKSLMGQLYCVPESKKTDVFNAILAKTNDLSILHTLTEHLFSVPASERCSAFNAILTKTDDPLVLDRLLGNLGGIDVSERSGTFRKVLNKTNVGSVHLKTADAIWCIPASEKFDAFLAILNKIDNVEFLESLKSHIYSLPVESRDAATQALTDRTKVLSR